ncbi:leucine-rich repeat extensin-like protein 7 [Iris pallida]|uniref:Leucine-rich repeat extensin-like protein 7 n=1 Tax=Iris pallida TaxID=29817 RepID=A0AAX6FDC1_IRIPA|nr:leucine-rich repeat extensin-like protein 7 [Iris pallida]
MVWSLVVDDDGVRVLLPNGGGRCMVSVYSRFSMEAEMFFLGLEEQMEGGVGSIFVYVYRFLERGQIRV